jgi:hypothetical protein
MTALHLIHQLLGIAQPLPIEQHPHFPFLGANDHGLLAHPAHQVKRRLGFSTQRLLQNVLCHALLQDFS